MLPLPPSPPTPEELPYPLRLSRMAADIRHSTATSGQTKVSGRKTNQTVEKTTRVTSSSLPRVKILPWVKIHPDPGGISNQSWILTLVGFATKLGEISFKNADAYVYTGLMLNAQNSFLLSTNEKLLFFPKHIQLVPKHCFLIFLFE